MRTMLALALALSLATLTAVADAAPRKHRAPRHDSQWMRECIDERTGPVDGVSKTEARKICKAEQPDDEVGAARTQLAIARSNAKVAKAKARVAKAIEACEQAVVDQDLRTGANGLFGGELSGEISSFGGLFGGGRAEIELEPAGVAEHLLLLRGQRRGGTARPRRPLR